MNKPAAACTIIARNYLSHARILARSYLRRHPGAKFFLLVIDELPAGVNPGPGIELIRPADLKLPYLWEMSFKYDVTELSTAVKPTLLRLLMRQYGEKRVIYLDPDIQVMRPMRGLFDAMESSGIVLLPHLLDPIPLDGLRPSEQDMLVSGAYNLGIIALSDTNETTTFLRWWEERLRDGARVDVARGLMTDQKWIDLVPGIFPSASIFRDETYNVAYWNIHTRRLTRSSRGEYLINDQPLTFFHFSGFDPSKPDVFSKHQSRTKVMEGSPLAQLLAGYVRLQLKHGWKTCSKWVYGYAHFNDGTPVHPLLRQVYLELDRRTRARQGNPFHVNGSSSFLGWATRPLRSTGLSPFAHRIYKIRDDLALTFPDIFGMDHAGFLQWAHESGAREMGYDSGLIQLPKSGRQRRARSSPPRNGLNIVGYLRSESGLGSAARGYIRALRSMRIPASFKDVGELSVNRSKDKTVGRLHTRHPYPVNLFCINADEHFTILSHVGEKFFRDHYNIAVWAWELPKFPAKWHNRFAYYDEIWVGSSFIANALSPVSPIPVIRIPPVLTIHGPGSRAAGRARLGVASEQFVFLFVFDFHSYFERKNPMAAIEAFKRAFGRSDQARLVIKCVNAKGNPEHFAEMQASAEGHSISIHEGYWPAEEMRDLMHACDAYVSLHRSEGTGLTISDAMSLGKPVIATGWSGNMDFMSASNSFPVRYELTKIKKSTGPYKAGEIWADPSIEHATELMRWVVEHPDDALARGNAARHDIHELFSETTVGELIRSRLTVISAQSSSSLLRNRAADKPSRLKMYKGLVGRVHDAVHKHVPRGATVAVVNKGDEELLKFDKRCGWHFPRDEKGGYAGFYPANSAAAVSQLELLFKKGARYLVLPNTAYWWLQYYRGFAVYLKRSAQRLHADDGCMIFKLASKTAKVGPKRVRVK